MGKIKVLIASTSYIILKGLNFILKESEDIDITWNTEVEEFLPSIIKNKPDFVILSREMLHQENLLELQKFHRKIKTRVICLKTDELPNVFPAFCDETISLYSDKNSLMEQLNQIVLKYIPEKPRKVNSTELSKREKNILRHIALGLTSKEIGSKLFISTHTVITHRKNISQKLGIKTVSGQTVYAILNGIVTMEEIGS
jgi:DNA-binding NarL/FixJ family response regulator